MPKPLLQFTVPGRPVSLNATYQRRAGSGRGLRLSDAARDYHARVQAAAIAALGHKSCPFECDVAIVITPHFTREADAGAVSKLVQDALEGIAYEDDRCVVFAGAWKGSPDPKNPRTEVSVWEIESRADWEDAWKPSHEI